MLTIFFGISMKYFVLTVFAAFIFSCSDSNSPVDNSKEDSSKMLMPNSIGNYWVYDRFEDNILAGVDSMVLTAHVQYKSKDAYMVECFSFDKDYEMIEKDTIFYAEEDGKLFINEQMEANPWYDNTWIQIYGDKSVSWIAARFDAENYDFEVTKEETYPVSYQNVLTAKYIYSDQLMFGGKSQAFDQFNIKNDLIGTFYKYIENDGVKDSVKYTGVRVIDQNYKIAKGTGLVDKLISGYKLVWAPAKNPYGMTQKIFNQVGETLQLVRYNVK